MSFFKRTAAAAVSIAMLGSSALAAEAIRPSMSVSEATRLGAPIRAGASVSDRVGAKNDLLGAPLYLIFLGALAITITTIIIIDNGNGHKSSPG